MWAQAGQPRGRLPRRCAACLVARVADPELDRSLEECLVEEHVAEQVAVALLARSNESVKQPEVELVDDAAAVIALAIDLRRQLADLVPCLGADEQPGD